MSFLNGIRRSIKKYKILQQGQPATAPLGGSPAHAVRAYFTYLLADVRVPLGVAVTTEAPLYVGEVPSRPCDRVSREHVVHARILEQKRGHHEGHHLIMVRIMYDRQEDQNNQPEENDGSYCCKSAMSSWSTAHSNRRSRDLI